MNPLRHTKTAVAALGRLQKTAKVSTLAALRVATGEPMNAALLRESFESLGATYIKLGQFIASTPSLFPKPYVDAFADCLDNTAPIPFGVISSVINKELAHLGGVSAFAHIDPLPLASASIAQVHKATLKSGELVALKVQKPKVLTTIHTDLSVLQAGAWLLQKTTPSLSATNLMPILAEVKERMLAETDFLQEAKQLAHFTTFLQQHGIDGVQAPSVYHTYSTKKILTMQFFEGISLIDERISQRADPAHVMGKVLDTWFLSLMTTGQFHADLHAGNLLLLTNGDVGFLDFGLVGYIDPKRLCACLALTQAITQNNPSQMAKAMIQMGMTHEQGTDEQRLADDLHELSLLGSKCDVHELNTHLLTIGKRHGIQFPKDFALLTKQLLYFDRFLQVLAPTMNLFENPVIKHTTPPAID